MNAPALQRRGFSRVGRAQALMSADFALVVRRIAMRNNAIDPAMLLRCWKPAVSRVSASRVVSQCSSGQTGGGRGFASIVIGVVVVRPAVFPRKRVRSRVEICRFPSLGGRAKSASPGLLTLVCGDALHCENRMASFRMIEDGLLTASMSLNRLQSMLD
jgi:hypothetical protein